jgi:hypothetical protein
MTTRFKDFGSGSVSKEPVKFKLHGEEFSCKPAIQGRVMLDLVAKSSDDNPSVVAKVIDEFFSSVLEEESLKNFNKLLEDKEKIVSVEVLGEISSWLIEQYSERPLVVPEPSSSGQ